MTTDQLDKLVDHWRRSETTQVGLREALRTPFLRVVNLGRLSDNEKNESQFATNNKNSRLEVFKVTPWQNPLSTGLLWGPADQLSKIRVEAKSACLDDNNDPMGDPRILALLAPESSRFFGFVFNPQENSLTIPSVDTFNNQLDALNVLLKKNAKPPTPFRYYSLDKKLDSLEYLNSVRQMLIPKSEKGSLWIHDTTYHSAFHFWPAEFEKDSSVVLAVAHQFLSAARQKSAQQIEVFTAIKKTLSKSDDLSLIDPKFVIEKLSNANARSFDVFNGNSAVNLLKLIGATVRNQKWLHEEIVTDAVSLLRFGSADHYSKVPRNLEDALSLGLADVLYDLEISAAYEALSPNTYDIPKDVRGAINDRKLKRRVKFQAVSQELLGLTQHEGPNLDYLKGKAFASSIILEKANVEIEGDQPTSFSKLMNQRIAELEELTRGEDGPKIEWSNSTEGLESNPNFKAKSPQSRPSSIESFIRNFFSRRLK